MSKIKKLPISVFIISKNEQDRILKSIASVIAWVDEVIVVDIGSTDATTTIAEAAGANVLPNKWTGYGNPKSFAESQCQNRWLLNLNPGESITSKLASEIKALFFSEPEKNIYKIHIIDLLAHEKTAHKWAYGCWQFRLYNKHYGNFSPSFLHDIVTPRHGSSIAKLKGKIEHRPQQELHFAIEQMNDYSDMQANDMLGRGHNVSPARMLSEFPTAFLKSYIFKRGFLYGWWGVMNAHKYALSRYLKVAKQYQRQHMSHFRN